MDDEYSSPFTTSLTLAYREVSTLPSIDVSSVTFLDSGDDGLRVRV